MQASVRLESNTEHIDQNAIWEFLYKIYKLNEKHSVCLTLNPQKQKL